jgi:hypothetical protein
MYMEGTNVHRSHMRSLMLVFFLTYKHYNGAKHMSFWVTHAFVLCEHIMWISVARATN